MTIRNGTEILPGWTLTFNEVSNSVYKVTLTDKFGRQISTTDTDLEQAIKTCESYAFDIERQISKSWTKFLFDTCILKLWDKTIIEKQYHEETFGSWYILLDNRIVLDNRDAVFYIQAYKEGIWIDKQSIKLKDLAYDNFIAALSSTK